MRRLSIPLVLLRELILSPVNTKVLLLQLLMTRGHFKGNGHTKCKIHEAFTQRAMNVNINDSLASESHFRDYGFINN